jgi:hypothetical protein
MAHQLYFVLILWFGLDMALGVALDCAARQRDTIIAISRTYNSMYNHEFYDLTWKSTNRKLHFHVTSHHSVTTNKISMKSPACSNLPLISHPPERTPETILKKENVNNPAPGGGEGRRTFFDAHASPWQFRHRSFAQTRPCRLALARARARVDRVSEASWILAGAGDAAAAPLGSRRSALAKTPQLGRWLGGYPGLVPSLGTHTVPEEGGW